MPRKEIQEYIEEKKVIYDNLMKFLKNENRNEKDFKNLIKIFWQQKKEENKEKLEKFLQLIVSVANNHHRHESLFKNIFQIIEYFEDQIKHSFTNIEIFNIFENNKKILLFLFKKKIIAIDQILCNLLLSKNDLNGNSYCHFFYPEIKSFIDEKMKNFIEKELLEKDSNIFDCFEEKREEGENDTFICSLIRKDSVEEFVKYVNKTNISIESEIVPSIFETNSFLNENNNITLIEYAAFFGSIQIFQYLVFNNAELKPSLWLYAIHSRNAELFHFLESNKIQPPKSTINKNDENYKSNDDYIKCFCESIKCHHNDFADYIENNLLSQNDGKIIRKNEDVISCIIQFHNYSYFPSIFDDGDEFFYLCSNNYHKLVSLFMKMKEESIKKEISDKINIYLI